MTALFCTVRNRFYLVWQHYTYALTVHCFQTTILLKTGFGIVKEIENRTSSTIGYLSGQYYYHEALSDFHYFLRHGSAYVN